MDDVSLSCTVKKKKASFEQYNLLVATADELIIPRPDPLQTYSDFALDMPLPALLEGLM